MGCQPGRHVTNSVINSTWKERSTNLTVLGTGTSVDSVSAQSLISKSLSADWNMGLATKNPRQYTDTEFTKFSTSSRCYFTSDSKTTKLTVRLSSDGSTLEIERYEVVLNLGKPLKKEYTRQLSEHRVRNRHLFPWKSESDLTKEPEVCLETS